jgi:hypothetical protein
MISDVVGARIAVPSSLDVDLMEYGGQRICSDGCLTVGAAWWRKVLGEISYCLLGIMNAKLSSSVLRSRKRRPSWS